MPSLNQNDAGPQSCVIVVLPDCAYINIHAQAYCVTEPACGSDVNGIMTKAVKKGDEVSIWCVNTIVGVVG